MFSLGFHHTRLVEFDRSGQNFQIKKKNCNDLCMRLTVLIGSQKTNELSDDTAWFVKTK
jgi:hypothetical protein